MYSVEDRFTFENLQEWIDNALDSIDDIDNFVWALVGNKSDLPLEIEHDTIKSRQEQLNTDLSYFTSAKTGENVTQAFQHLIEAIHRKKVGAKGTPLASAGGPAKTVKIGRTTTSGVAKKDCAC